MSTAEIQPQITQGQIAIRPYLEASSGIGLEEVKLAVFDGVTQSENMACIEENGNKRYKNGLNEYDLSIKKLPESERKAAIQEIRKTIARIEKEKKGNTKPEKNLDDEIAFWNSLELCHFTNDAFWGTYQVTVGNNPVFLDPNKIDDLILIKAIEAGGFSLVEPSLEAAQTAQKPKRFYLDRLDNTAAYNASPIKLKNKARGILNDLNDGDQKKMFYLVKLVDLNSGQYKQSTPLDYIYLNLDKHIDGQLSNKDKTRSVKIFLELAALELGDLKAKAIIKDAIQFRQIISAQDGALHVANDFTKLGRNPDEAFQYIKNPANTDVYNKLLAAVEVYWNQ